MPRRTVCKPSVVGVARAGVVSVPPIRAPGNLSLAIQPRAPAITIPIAIVAGPPSDSDCHEAVVKAIVEVAVIGEVIVVEVIVIVAMPIVAMPSTMAAIPGNVTAAAMPTGAGEVGAAHVASMPTAASEVGATHVASPKATAHVASTKVATTAKMTSSTEMTTTAVAGIGHDWGKKQATCKGSYCGYTHSHDYSPWARLARDPSADFVMS
jgi:hypothetical protein